ncbi:hypothetical protein CDEN61S_00575 [Castellaniella denitrificans]
MRELQDIGVRIVLDDMGSGHAELSALNDARYDVGRSTSLCCGKRSRAPSDEKS